MLDKWTRYTVPFFAVAFLTLAGCGGGADQADTTTEGEEAEIAANEPAQTQAEPKTQTQTPATKPATKPADKPATKPADKPKEVVIPASAEKEFTIPAGEVLLVTLNTRLSTDSSEVGQRFSATLVEAVVVEGVTVVPNGAAVSGRVTHVEEPHRTSGKAQMTLLVDQVTDATGKTYAVQTAPLAMEAEGDKISDEEKVAAGAVVGGIIGAITKKKIEGAAVGAAVGAAAGGAVALATKGKQLEFEPGQAFAFEVLNSDKIPVVVKQ